VTEGCSIVPLAGATDNYLNPTARLGFALLYGFARGGKERYNKNLPHGSYKKIKIRRIAVWYGLNFKLRIADCELRISKTPHSNMPAGARLLWCIDYEKNV
jgi:hypothetical protein